MRAIAAAVCLLSFNAIGGTVNLDRPGALADLEKERPEHYRTVVDTVRAAERMHCGVDLKALQVGDKDPCRSHMIRTSFPAHVKLSIPLDDALYVVTAYLDTLDRPTPAK